jgi:hypothetical protein
MVSGHNSSLPRRKEEHDTIAGRAALALEPIRDPGLARLELPGDQGGHVAGGMQSKDPVTDVSGGRHVISPQIGCG